MKPIKTYIRRILFRLGFCRKEAKIVLNTASNNNNCICYYYMCSRLSSVLYLRAYLDLSYSFTKHARYLRAYGFTRKNYHKFVRKNYPDLVKYLRYSPYTYWILPYEYYLGGIIDESLYYKILESKSAFLKHLADKL